MTTLTGRTLRFSFLRTSVRSSCTLGAGLLRPTATGPRTISRAASSITMNVTICSPSSGMALVRRRRAAARYSAPCRGTKRPIESVDPECRIFFVDGAG